MWITTPRREGSGSEHAQGFDLITKARGLLASIIFPQAHTVGMVPILACKQGESMTAKRRPLTEAPDDLTTEEKVEIVKWVKRKQAEGILPKTLGKREMRKLCSACLEGSGMNDVRRRKWARAVKAWILTEEEIKRDRKRERREREYPQEDRHEGGMEDISTILRMVK